MRNNKGKAMGGCHPKPQPLILCVVRHLSIKRHHFRPCYADNIISPSTFFPTALSNAYYRKIKQAPPETSPSFEGSSTDHRTYRKITLNNTVRTGVRPVDNCWSRYEIRWKNLVGKMLAIYWVVTFLHNYFVSAFICLFACLLVFYYLLPIVGE